MCSRSRLLACLQSYLIEEFPSSPNAPASRTLSVNRHTSLSVLVLFGHHGSLLKTLRIKERWNAKPELFCRLERASSTSLSIGLNPVPPTRIQFPIDTRPCRELDVGMDTLPMGSTYVSYTSQYRTIYDHRVPLATRGRS